MEVMDIVAWGMAGLVGMGALAAIGRAIDCCVDG